MRGYTILLLILTLVSCTDNDPVVVIYENSSNIKMELEVSLNTEVLDTIEIPEIDEQDYQRSIRKIYSNSDKYNFRFRELNSGKVISKTYENINGETSFVILGLGKSIDEFKLDTITYDYVPKYM